MGYSFWIEVAFMLKGTTFSLAQVTVRSHLVHRKQKSTWHNSFIQTGSKTGARKWAYFLVNYEVPSQAGSLGEPSFWAQMLYRNLDKNATSIYKNKLAFLTISMSNIEKRSGITRYLHNHVVRK